MQRLILFRHGEAERNSSTGKDFDRPLAPRGREDARHVAHALAKAGAAPDLVLVSQASRTQQTWAAAQPTFPQSEVRVDPALYQAEAKALLEIAERAPARTVMLVTHNPGVHDLALQLAEDAGDTALKARLELGFPAAAAAVIEFGAGERPTSGRLFLPSECAPP